MICTSPKLRAILILLGLPLLMVGCDPIIVTESYYYEHCVEGYYKVASINVEPETISVNGIPYTRLTVGAMHNGQKIEDQEYEQLSQSHGDTGGEHWSIWCDMDVFPTADLNEITVTAIDDWDEDHKAGTCLNDMIHFTAYSVYPYIRNGYSEVPDESPASDFRGCVSSDIRPHRISNLIDKELKSVTKDNLTLIGGGLTMKLFDLFLPQKKSTGPCRISILVKDISGKEFSADVTL